MSISILMGVYNDGARLQDTIESVLRQSLDAFELLIVDDGSTDPLTGQILVRASADPRVRVLRQANAGLTRALIQGADKAAYPYLARVDAGDAMAPERLERQLAFLESHPACVFVSCATEFCGPAWEPLWVTLGAPTEGGTVDAVPGWPENRAAADVSHHGSVMMRTEAYQAAGGYRSPFHFGQDWDLWYRLARLGRFGMLPEVLYRARFFPDAISMQRADWQRRFAECSAGAHRAAMAGKSEAFWVERATALRESFLARPSGGGRRREPGYYFIGEALRRRGDARCRNYLGRAVREAPLRPRGYVRLVQSLLLGGGR